jgi:hypothetical protein
VVPNAGTFRKSGGTGTVPLTLTNLGGMIDVRSGTLAVASPVDINGQGPSWTGGTFQVAQGAFLDWIGEDNFKRYSLEGNYSGSGEGKVQLVSGRLKFAGAGSTFDFVPGLFEWTGNFTEIDGGPGGLTNLGMITLAGTGEKRLSRALNNAGTIVHGGTGALVTSSAGALTNLPGQPGQPGGIYDFAADVSMSPSLFINRGTLRKSDGTGTATMLAGTFQNESGTIEVEMGTLDLGSRVGSNTGSTILVA